MKIDPFDPQRLHSQFLDSMTTNGMRTIGAIVAWAHVRAPGIGAERWGDVGRSRSGVLRWIQIDADLIGLKGKMPGVDIELCDNPSGGGTHIEVGAGNLRMLLAHDSDPQTLVPVCDYGKLLTRSNTNWLFPELQAEEDAKRKRNRSTYYAVLFHSKASSKGDAPYCLEVRFPDGEEKYAADHLKLYALFPELMDETWLLKASMNWMALPVAKEEKIKEEGLPKLRRPGQVGN